jgi:hypothetical protein
MMRLVDVNESEDLLYLVLVKNKITLFQHVLELQHIQGPRVVCIKLLEYVLDFEVPLPFSFIEEVFFRESTRVTLFEPL